jgi:hypothetical protein
MLLFEDKSRKREGKRSDECGTPTIYHFYNLTILHIVFSSICHFYNLVFYVCTYNMSFYNFVFYIKT